MIKKIPEVFRSMAPELTAIIEAVGLRQETATVKIQVGNAMITAGNTGALKHGFYFTRNWREDAPSVIFPKGF